MFGVHDVGALLSSAQKLFLSNLLMEKQKTYGVHWYVSRFYFLLKHNRLKWRSYIYNALGVQTITRLITSKEQARLSYACVFNMP